MLAFVFISMLIGAQSSARGVAVSGVVEDQTAAVLPNAQIVLLVTGADDPVQSGTTDAAGAFRFESVAPGNYQVRAEYPGFKTVAVNVRVGARAPGPLTIVLPLEGLTQEIAVSSGDTNLSADARANLNAISVDADTLDNLP